MQNGRLGPLTVAATLTRPFLRTDHAGDDAPSDACDTALEKACGAERTRAFECAECAGSHQQALRAAGCENAAIALWCAGVAMEIADIFLRNITAVDELPPGAAGMLREGHGGGGKIAEPGSFVCSARAPCPSVHLTDVHISTKKKKSLRASFQKPPRFQTFLTPQQQASILEK